MSTLAACAADAVCCLVLVSHVGQATQSSLAEGLVELFLEVGIDGRSAGFQTLLTLSGT